MCSRCISSAASPVDCWATTHRTASARMAASSSSSIICQPGGSPSSSPKLCAICTKKLSSVPTRNRCRRRTSPATSRRHFARSIGPPWTCWLSSASLPASSAAAASRVRTRSRISPAALRVNVLARIASNGSPAAASPMNRLLSWNVLPVPADARMTRLEKQWLILPVSLCARVPSDSGRVQIR